jgi:hypothetical protein
MAHLPIYNNLKINLLLHHQERNIIVKEQTDKPMNENGSHTPREILNKFYTENNLPQDGGQNSKSVKIELFSGFHIYFPNFNARRKAVVMHDIHHLITEYDTSLRGESEISAWEIASGCKKYRAAFLLDTSGLMLGFLFNFPRILKAFARGRRTKNLYHDEFSVEQALDMKIAELRDQMYLDKYPKYTKPTFIDFILLSLFSLFGLMFSILSFLLIPFIAFYSLYIVIMKPKELEIR